MIDLVNTQVESHALLRRGFGTSVPFIVAGNSLVNSTSILDGQIHTSCHLHHITGRSRKEKPPGNIIIVDPVHGGHHQRSGETGLETNSPTSNEMGPGASLPTPPSGNMGPGTSPPRGDAEPGTSPQMNGDADSDSSVICDSTLEQSDSGDY